MSFFVWRTQDLRKVEFIKSAKVAADFPPGKQLEVAIVGRSNAGKSSFINLLARSKVALVSQTPGKTRLLNFFDYQGEFRLVDMPGYGFASRAGDEQFSWQEMVEGYLFHREQLRGLVLVMDIRRSWDDEEELIKTWAEKQEFQLMVVLTKADKMSRSARLQKVKEIQKVSGLSEVFAVSVLKKEGHEPIERHIFSHWIQGE